MEQRYVPLTFTAGAGTLTATVPPNMNTAVPGRLHALHRRLRGRPLGGEMVALDPRRRRRLRPRPLRRPPPNQPPTRVAHVAGERREVHLTGQDPLAATASDPDGTVTRVEFFNGTTKLGEDTTAPYTLQWNVGAAGTYTLTARATDNAGATKTSSAAASPSPRSAEVGRYRAGN